MPAAIGGFASNWYWSSSEDDANDAWVQFFGNEGQTYAGKPSTFRVRAVRSF
jgi:hypothetical protein